MTNVFRRSGQPVAPRFIAGVAPTNNAWTIYSTDENNEKMLLLSIKHVIDQEFPVESFGTGAATSDGEMRYIAPLGDSLS